MGWERVDQGWTIQTVGVKSMINSVDAFFDQGGKACLKGKGDISLCIWGDCKGVVQGLEANSQLLFHLLMDSAYSAP